MDDIEIKASKYAGQCGGEVLEEFGKFDLSNLTPDQWTTFIQTICKNYELKKIELTPCPF